MGNKCSEQCVAQAEGYMRVTTPNTPPVPITITHCDHVPTVVIIEAVLSSLRGMGSIILKVCMQDLTH